MQLTSNSTLTSSAPPTISFHKPGGFFSRNWLFEFVPLCRLKWKSVHDVLNVEYLNFANGNATLAIILGASIHIEFVI